MHGIKRQSKGKYGTSAVLGYYRATDETDDCRRQLQEIHKSYWIVRDKKKERLMRIMKENDNY